MVKLIFHKNPERIGGGMTELRSGVHRLIIDMGADLPQEDLTPEPNPELPGLTCGAPTCEAVLISHYHGDHAGLLKYVLPGIPIYMSRVTRSVLRVVKATLLRHHLGGVTPEELDQLEQAHLFTYADWGKPHQLGVFTVTPVRQDHSAYDALGFIVQVENVKIFFTGDFRSHGYTGNKTVAMCQKYVGKADYIICEGTMLSRHDELPLSEPELCDRAIAICRKYKHVLVLAASTNLDTQVSFYRAARATRKLFKVDSFQQQLYDALLPDQHSPIYDFTQPTATQPRGLVILVRASQQKFMEAFYRKYGQDSVLVYSLWQGYIPQQRSLQQLQALWGDRFLPLHTSGHAQPALLKQVIAACSMPATVVIPMHTQSFDAWDRLGLPQKLLKTAPETAYTLKITSSGDHNETKI